MTSSCVADERFPTTPARVSAFKDLLERWGTKLDCLERETK